MGLFSKLKSALSFSFVYEESAPPLTPAQERGLALGAVYAAEGYLPINALTMQADPKTAAQVIRGPWGVTDAESARSTYAWLLTGPHDQVWRAARQVQLTPLTGKRKEQGEQYVVARDAAQPLSGQTPAEFEKTTMQWGLVASVYGGLPSGLSDAVRATPPTSILAWDTARVVHLSRLVLDAGFLTADEVWPIIDQAVALAKTEYASWQEFSDAFLVGRFFWQAALCGNPSGASSDLDGFITGAKHLFEEETSPWRTIAW